MELQRTVVVLYILAASLLGSDGLEFHLDTSHDVCGKLSCSVDSNVPNHEILSVLELAVFDTTQNSSRLLLASISILEPVVDVNDALKQIISASGNISDYHAELHISLRKQSFCHSGSFVCELTYINPSGHSDVLQSTEVKAENDGSADGVNPGVPSEIMDVIEELINRTINIESAQVRMEQKLDGAAQELSNVADLLTELVADKQKHNCYKGMASCGTSYRTVITVLDNKTALCDTNTDGGGWVVIQRRANGIENFYRGWTDYKAGFGNVSGGGDYWLGNEAIHQLTSMGNVELRVDMVYQGKKYYAQYSVFSIGNETTYYTLNVDGYSGDSGDSLHDHHNNMKFSTFDRDNDFSTTGSCAEVYHGAWWYNNCYYSHLNGVLGSTDNTSPSWNYNLGHGLSFTEMKIRSCI